MKQLKFLYRGSKLKGCGKTVVALIFTPPGSGPTHVPGRARETPGWLQILALAFSSFAERPAFSQMSPSACAGTAPLRTLCVVPFKMEGSETSGAT